MSPFLLFGEGQRNSCLPVGLLFTVLCGGGSSEWDNEGKEHCGTAAGEQMMGSVWFLWMKHSHWRGVGRAGDGD